MNEKYALYARVSTDEQSTEQQIHRLEEYAKARGWEYESFAEVESTRKTRPVKAKLLHKLRLKEFDGVCVWKLDRWGRSTTEIILEIQELYDKGVSFVSLQDNIDVSTSSGKFFVTVLAAFAELERDLISERTKEGLRRAVRNGKKLGRPRKYE